MRLKNKKNSFFYYSQKKGTEKTRWFRIQISLKKVVGLENQDRSDDRQTSRLQAFQITRQSPSGLL